MSFERNSKLSHSLIVAMALSTILVLMLVLAVTIGSAQAPSSLTLQLEHTLSPGTLQVGKSAVGELVIHNPSPRAVGLDILTVELPEGLAYVGQAAGSDVTAAAEVDGLVQRWSGPFNLAAGETLIVRYWVVAASAPPGEYLARAAIASGGKILSAVETSVEVGPAAAPKTVGATKASSLLISPGLSGEISATKTAEPTELRPGSPLAYTVVFANTSDNDVTMDAITDVLPVPFQYVGLAVGSEVVVEPVDTGEPEIVWQGTFVVPANDTLTLRYWVWVPIESEAGSTPYVNTVTAAYDGTLVGPAEASVILTAPDVQVAKSVWPQAVLAGEPVTYTVVLENVGSAQGVVDLISDTLPTGFAFLRMLPESDILDPPDGVTGTIVWHGPLTMAIGEVKTLMYQAQSSTASGLEAPTNRVVALVEEKLTQSAGAAVQVDSTLLFYLPTIMKGWDFPYFEVTKTATPNQVDQDGLVTYTVSFTNHGDFAGVLKEISDTLPGDFTFVSMEDGSDVVAPPAGTTGTIVWSGPFQVGPHETLTLVYSVNVGDEPGTQVNSATATTLVGHPPREPASAAVVVTEPIFLSEDFESGTDGWEPFLNYWRLHPEQWYLQAGSGYGGSTGLRHTYFYGVEDPARGAHDALYMYRGDGAEQWTNYRLETRVRMDEGSYIGLWVRGKYYPGDEGDGKHVEGYYISWHTKRDYDNVQLSRLRPTGSTAFHFSDPELLTTGDYLLLNSTWYNVAVEVRDSNIKVFIDDNLVINHNDATYSQGTVGFFCYKVAYGTWDNVLVMSLD